MADAVIQLRRITDETDSDSIYTDTELASRISDAANIYAAARDIWMEKLAVFAGFVNISEGGSSRSMSQAYDHAKEMVAFYTSLAEGSGGNSTGAVMRKIQRV